MTVIPFFDPTTWTMTYLVYDAQTLDAVIIDPVLDFDPARVETATTSADAVIAKVEELGLKVHLIVDTHAHADHLSAFQHLKEQVGGQTAIGAQISEVQQVFKGIFNLPDEFATDGSQWDVLLEDGQPFHAGSLTLEPMHSPGHTPSCYAYRIRDAVFCGDVLFMPDFGTGRCDFPGGSASDLYDSIQRLYALPGDTRVFVGHDYGVDGRPIAWETTIAESRTKNKHLRTDTSREDFVAMRTARDATLSPPRLIFQSLQVNANAGVLPPAEANGRRIRRIPLGRCPA